MSKEICQSDLLKGILLVVICRTRVHHKQTKMKLLECIVFLSASMWVGTVIPSAKAGKQPAGNPDDAGADETDGADEADDPELAKYREMFLERRSQHMPALQSLFESYDYEQQHRMITMLLEKMEEMLGQSRKFLTEKQFQIGAKFPAEQTLRDTVSLILENVAFVGDISLRLPDVTHGVLKRKKALNDILKWAFEFVQATGYYDDAHQTLLHLASQELNFIEREPSFTNPYSRKNAQMFEPPSKPKKEKKYKKRGPRVSKTEL